MTSGVDDDLFFVAPPLGVVFVADVRLDATKHDLHLISRVLRGFDKVLDGADAQVQSLVGHALWEEVVAPRSAVHDQELRHLVACVARAVLRVPWKLGN